MTKVVPKVVPEVEKPFIYAVKLTSRKLWSRPLEPPLWSRTLGRFLEAQAERGSADTSQKLARFIFSGFPRGPQTSLLHGRKGGLLPQKRHRPPGDMGQSRFSQCKSWMATVVQVNTLITDVRNASVPRTETCLSSSNPKAPILNKSPDQLGRYEFWLVGPKKKFGHKTLGVLFCAPCPC